MNLKETMEMPIFLLEMPIFLLEMLMLLKVIFNLSALQRRLEQNAAAARQRIADERRAIIREAEAPQTNAERNLIRDMQRDDGLAADHRALNIEFGNAPGGLHEALNQEVLAQAVQEFRQRNPDILTLPFGEEFNANWVNRQFRVGNPLLLRLPDYEATFFRTGFTLRQLAPSRTLLWRFFGELPPNVISEARLQFLHLNLAGEGIYPYEVFTVEDMAERGPNSRMSIFDDAQSLYRNPNPNRILAYEANIFLCDVTGAESTPDDFPTLERQMQVCIEIRQLLGAVHVALQNYIAQTERYSDQGNQEILRNDLLESISRSIPEFRQVRRLVGEQHQELRNNCEEIANQMIGAIGERAIEIITRPELNIVLNAYGELIELLQDESIAHPTTLRAITMVTMFMHRASRSDGRTRRLDLHLYIDFLRTTIYILHSISAVTYGRAVPTATTSRTPFSPEDTICLWYCIPEVERGQPPLLYYERVIHGLSTRFQPARLNELIQRAAEVPENVISPLVSEVLRRIIQNWPATFAAQMEMIEAREVIDEFIGVIRTYQQVPVADLAPIPPFFQPNNIRLLIPGNETPTAQVCEFLLSLTISVILSARSALGLVANLANEAVIAVDGVLNTVIAMVNMGVNCLDNILPYALGHFNRDPNTAVVRSLRILAFSINLIRARFMENPFVAERLQDNRYSYVYINQDTPSYDSLVVLVPVEAHYRHLVARNLPTRIQLETIAQSLQTIRDSFGALRHPIPVVAHKKARRSRRRDTDS